MKKRDVKIVFYKMISILTVFSLLAGVFSVFPSLASPVLSVSAEDGKEENIYTEQSSSVVFDADYMKGKGRLSGASQCRYGFETVDGMSVLRLTSKVEYKDDGSPKHDPYLSFNPEDIYSADEYKYVTILVRTDAKYAKNNTFRIFYKINADGKGNYVKTQHKGREYNATDEWQLLVYDMSDVELWSGGNIKGIRFDFFDSALYSEEEKRCDIAAVILSKTPAGIYDTAFDLMQSVYPSVQKLSDFTEEELSYFERAEGNAPNGTPWLPSLDNVLEEKDGNLLYTFEYDDSVEHSGPDPYSGFFYDEFADARGIDKLTTRDFGYTVMRYRTFGDVGNPNMQLFYFANGSKEPTFIGENAMAPSANYTASTENDWKTLVVDMAGGDNAAGWTGAFDGFRIDWCSPSSVDAEASMEISDILFFKDGTAAKAFSAALNQIDLALVEEEEYTESYDNPIKLSEDCLMMLPEALIDKIVDSDNSTHYVTNDSGVSVLRLETTKAVDSPFVTFKPDDINADEYKYITLAIRKNVPSKAALTIRYTTDKTEEGDRNHYMSRYDAGGDWQLVTIDLESEDAWNGIVDEIKLSYLSSDPIYTGYAEKTCFDIAGIAFSKTAEDLYDSAYYLMVQAYRPVQVLTSFTEDDLPSFSADQENNGKLSDTKVFVENGDLRYEAVDDYSDPFAAFYYKNLMDARGVAEEDRLTTKDFCATVVRYRTPTKMKSPGMQFFIYTGENYGPFKVEGTLFTTSAGYSPTHYDTWRSMCLVMNGNSTTSSGWTGDFNGFRVDWCGSSAFGEYMDISEFFFFKDKDAAAKFTAEVNSLFEPFDAEFNDAYMTSASLPENVLMLSPEEMEDGFEDSDNTTHYTARDGHIPLLRLEITDASATPYITFKPENVDADEYKYITLAIRSNRARNLSLKINYTTDKSTDINKQYSERYYSSNSSYYDEADIDNWQIVTLNLSGKASWSGIVDEIRLAYLNYGYGYENGDQYDIAGIAFSKTEDGVFDAAHYMLTQIYRPVQAVTDFAEEDLGYFGGAQDSGQTVLSAENGNIRYTATGTSDPQKMFSYLEYANAKGLKPVTTDVFQYTVIRYKAQNVASANVNLFILTGDANGLGDMIRVEGTVDCHKGAAKYYNTDLWRSMVINMAAQDGLPDNTGLKYGWYREDGNNTFKGFRVDWCDSGVEGSYLEVSDYLFFADIESAEAYSNAINSISIPDPLGDPEEETTETTGTETLPDFEDTTVVETLPDFEDTTIEDQTDETMPKFDDPITTEPPIIVDTEESDIDTDESLTEDGGETEESSEDERETETDESERETESSAKNETVDGLRFELNASGDGYTVYGDGASGDVVIPATYNGLPVTAIGGEAFKGSASITSITIPDTIISIGDNAFEGCTELETVYYEGSEAQWAEIEIGKDNAPLSDGDVIYANAETTETESEGSSLDTETESDTESESDNGNAPPNSGGDIGGIVPDDPNAPGEAPNGSKMPFYIACGVLAALSLASVAIVIVIKIKTRA